MLTNIYCSPDSPCGSCEAFLRHPFYQRTVAPEERPIFHDWLFADQGMDMDWQEFKTWHCPRCRELKSEINAHQNGVPHG